LFGGSATNVWLSSVHVVLRLILQQQQFLFGYPQVKLEEVEVKSGEEEEVSYQA
jgi:hypothetical protein